MTTRRYSAINRCAKQTATKDLVLLRDMGILEQLEGGGRSTAYRMNPQVLEERL